MSDYQIGTNCLHAGYRPGNGEPRNFPIVQSTTFRYETSEEMGKLFDLEASGYSYTRLQNPTNDTVAAKICALEGGTAAMLLSSGQAASFYSIFNIASCGDHVVSSSTIYGGTINLFGVTLKKHRRGAQCGLSAQYQGRFWGDHCQPGPDCAGHRKVCRCGPQPWGPPDHRQHLCYPGELPTL